MGASTKSAPSARRRRWRRAMSVLLAAAVGGLGAGCTSGSENSAGGGAGAACAAPGVTADSVRLGLLYPDTGVFASLFTGVRSGVEARLAVQNERGGVHGRSITYDWADDSGINANLIAARDLVEKRGTFAIIEETSGEDGSAAYLAEKGVPVIGAGSGYSWTTHPNMFTWSALASENRISSVWGAAAGQGGARVAVLSVPFMPSAQQLAQAIAASMRWVGANIVYENLQISRGTSLRELAAAITRTDANIITGVISPEIWAELAPALRASGADIRISLFPNGYDQTSLARLGPAQAGTYIALSTAPFELDLPVHRAYLDAMARFAPQIQPPQNQLALNGWLAADLMIRGLEEAGPCLTRRTFITKLRAVRDYDGDGLVSPPVAFSNHRDPIRCLFIVRVSADGRQYEPQGSEPACGQIVSWPPS